MPTVTAQTLRNYIANAQIEKAIDAMREITASTAADWAIPLDAQAHEFKQLSRDKMLGLIDFKEEGIRRAKVVNNLLNIVGEMEKEGVFADNATITTPPHNLPAGVEKQQLLNLVNQNELDEVIAQLDAHFAQRPNAQYSLLRQTILHALQQGQAPNPPTITALKIFIRGLN
ncbi:hypothetical protein [Haliscomenobacter hydrossis]|uniref:Effector-associated domain-containing protein n=1 Tax=Haliscomenobacter hydrossis (strain ATCC 27775 / DSM 1100 / LMG 10767 / O) TaxID=760192 RepID=F4KV08_HALH1|nr:hypothetical protein [Haliscomenobacter hydrossis]AEE49174.1 hypothetical protein Halhy_1279 [Haliscomenobacter hydrossis DSM 1100]